MFKVEVSGSTVAEVPASCVNNFKPSRLSRVLSYFYRRLGSHPADGRASNLAPSTDALSLAAAPEEDSEVAEPCRGPTEDLGLWSDDNVGVAIDASAATPPPSDDGV